MDLPTFNLLPAAAAADVVRPCADIDDWVATVVAGRPYPDLDALLDAARSAAAGWGADELDAALAHHPRIGERPGGSSTEATLSRGEQPPDDDGTSAGLARGNAAYEARFDRIFLVRAAGRSAPEILELLTRRLDNDPATETAVAAGELREIALLRLTALITGRAA